MTKTSGHSARGMLDKQGWSHPQLWLNPNYGAPPEGGARFGLPDIRQAEARLDRFAPLIMRLFPETTGTAGIIESPLVPLAETFYMPPQLIGKAWVKCDHALAVAGSIKARGGVHEVLEFAEALAMHHKLIDEHKDYATLAEAEAKKVFSAYEISVGSTGNLGMSIGLIAKALGFRATVHMSSDAKRWKKEKLRESGVQVIEHRGDYAQAVAAGRQKSEEDPHGYFVDDEQSTSLFLGYSVAALRLAVQIRTLGIEVDAENPLFVYLPCGVGGAPSGITFGLKALLGHNVHCFFVEPTASPCFLVRMKNPDRPDITVYDVGLDNITEADGLAVPAASELAVAQMRSLLSGILTTTDNAMFIDVYKLYSLQGMRIEPSAAAGFTGPRLLLGTPQGQRYLRAHNLDEHIQRANHIVWSTGGLFVPDAEFEQFLARGRALNSSLSRHEL